MHQVQKKHLLFLIMFLFSVQGFSQIYNTEVEAKIITEKSNDLLKITGSAYNKTEISQSLRYVLSVIRTNPENSNSSKNDQSGRIVLETGEQKNLSTTTININEQDRVILLLLIYNIDDQIIGQDRIVINDNLSDTDVKEQIQKEVEETIHANDVDAASQDGITLKGIVTEDTKTKPGRDFYTMFYSSYNTNNINGNKIVSVKEVIAFGNNTKIEIFVGDDKVVEFFLKPQNEFLKSMSEASVRRVSQHFQRLKREANIIKRY